MRNTALTAARPPASTLLFVSLAAVLALGGTATGQGPERFGLTEVGNLPDADPSIPTDPTSTALAINDAGRATGSSWVSGGCIAQPPAVICERIIVHAFLWDAGNLQDLGAPIQGLAPMEYTSIGWGINNNDWIAGEYQTDLDPYRHAFIWRPQAPGTGFAELPGLIGTNARAWDLNDAGVVVGESTWAGGSGNHAVFWTQKGEGWAATDLGTLGGGSSSAFGVNGRGEITGMATLANGQQTTFLFLPQPAYGLGAGMHDATPQIGGDLCNDINEKGEMVGGAGVFPLPMIVLPQPAYGLPAGPTVFGVDEVAPQSTLDELGATALIFADFTSINDLGLATVNAWFLFPGGSQQQHGMLFQDGVFRLATSATVASERWPRMTGAEEANNSGQIAAAGIEPGGDFLGVVLDPADCQEDLGFQGPGAGSATLCGSGLDTGESSDYEVVGASANVTGAVLLSVDGFANLPILGGTLVSFGGYVSQVPVTTSPVGAVWFTVPGLGIAVDLVLQTVLFDAAAPRGVAFSNAVRARFGQ